MAIAAQWREKGAVIKIVHEKQSGPWVTYDQVYLELQSGLHCKGPLEIILADSMPLARTSSITPGWVAQSSIQTGLDYFQGWDIHIWDGWSGVWCKANAGTVFHTQEAWSNAFFIAFLFKKASLQIILLNYFILLYNLGTLLLSLLRSRLCAYQCFHRQKYLMAHTLKDKSILRFNTTAEALLPSIR